MMDSVTRSSPTLSFILPARNEEAHLGAVLDSVREAAARGALACEILVVDHGSTDGTRSVAREHGAQVLSWPDAPSIAALRNRGAETATAPILVFLDADVSLARDWGERFRETSRRLAGHRETVTGSEVLCPPGGSWIQRIWFGVPGRDRNHVNSGHFIIARDFFLELGGFDPGLRTGEDHDLTQRALAAGARIEPDRSLHAFHHGFPRTLRQFFLRELWHGRSTFESLKQLASSRVSLVTAVLLVIGVAGAAAATALGSLWPLLLPLVALAGASLLAGLMRPRRSAADLPAIVLLYVVYFSARCLSPLSYLAAPAGGHWKRRS